MRKKMFSQTYVLYDDIAVVKPTHVSELDTSIFFLNSRYSQKKTTKHSNTLQKTIKQISSG